MPTIAELWSHWRSHGAAAPYLLLDAAAFEGGGASLPVAACVELQSLLAGDLADELEDVAPYVGRLRSWDEEPAAAACRAMQEEAGILVLLRQDEAVQHSFADVRRHFRKFNIVYGPDNVPVFFRYYDPRVLPMVLKVLEPDQLCAFFGPVQSFVTSDPQFGVSIFSLVDGRLHEQR